MDQPTPRRSFRFGLKTMLLVLAAICMVCAGLFTGDPVWAEIISTVAAVALILAAIAAIFGERSARPYWGSFLIGALAYMVLAMFPIQSLDTLPTTRLLNWLQPHIGMTQARRHADPGFELTTWAETPSLDLENNTYVINGANQNGSRRVYFLLESRPYTLRIGHCVFALLFGLVVAEVSRVLLRWQANRHAAAD